MCFLLGKIALYDDLLRKFSVGFFLSLSLSLQYTILVVSKWTNESNLSIANPIFTSSWFDSDKIKSVVHTVEYVVRSSLAPAK